MKKHILLMLVCVMLLCSSCNMRNEPDDESNNMPSPTVQSFDTCTCPNRYGLEQVTPENSKDGIVHGDVELSREDTYEYGFVSRDENYDPFGIYKERPGSAYQVVVVPTPNDAVAISDKILLQLQADGYYLTCYTSTSKDECPDGLWGFAIYYEEHDVWAVYYVRYIEGTDDCWTGASLCVAISRSSGEVIRVWHGEF